MRYPWINTALFVILVVLLLTGFFGLTTGADRGRWVLWLHGAAGYVLVLMFAWKGRVILDVLRRVPRLGTARLAFLLLILLTLAAVVTGLIWTTTGPAHLSVFSIMTVHAVLGIPIFVLLGWHTVARRYVVRVRHSRDRRAFLRFAGLTVGGAALWAVVRSTKTALALPAAGRRFTGSFETGSLTGVFPFVSWLFDHPAPVDAAAWRLRIDGAVDKPVSMSYADLLSMPAEPVRVTLDCTGGWYSLQEWRGVRLDRLLEMAGVAAGAESVSIVSISGYSRRFPIETARDLVLATHVAGRPLEHGHGFPVRLVAPGYRGFNWVKWVQAIEVNTTSELLQPPLPLQ
ncbi:MAG: molybdopterin-dependent oxidoreductase [Nitrososphaerales archaeon]